MILRGKILLVLVLLHTLSGNGQGLEPGFSKEEYRKLLHISAHTTADSNYYKDFPLPANYQRAYRSRSMGLDNQWELWMTDNLAIISIRGTTRKAESWLANFYSAMVPAKGQLTISGDYLFRYNLAADDKAAVHVGWLLCTAYLSRDILPKIDSCYKQGIRNFLIMGHSQGGAISYLLTAHLRHLIAEGKIPADIILKTYCSASPKPGNLFFAYDYESKTREGWSYNVVNSADWVPETPVSIQTVNDLNKVNPFANAKTLIRKQKFPKNLAFRYVYNRLNNPIKKAQKNYENYLGNRISKEVIRYLPDFRPPKYVHSNHYVRTGITVVLLADEDYFRRFPDDSSEIFRHHFHKPYLYLLEKY